MDILFVLDYERFQNDFLEVAKKVAKYSNIIWFRIKNKDANLIYDLSKQLRRTLNGANLILSERADIAHLLNFQGVQLNAKSLNPIVVENTYPNLKVGYSAHSIDEIKNTYADFFTLSPIFWTKKDYKVNPLGKVDVSCLNETVYALGGINSKNITEIVNCGFKGVAGISFYEDIEQIIKFLHSFK